MELCLVGGLQTLELLGPQSRHLSVPLLRAMLNGSVTLALAFAGHCFLTEVRDIAAPETQTQGLSWSSLLVSPHLSVTIQKGILNAYPSTLNSNLDQ